MVEILVLKFVIPVACTYGEPLCDEVGQDLFIDCLPLCGGRDRANVNSYQPFP